MGVTVRVPSTDRGDRMEPGTDSAAVRIVYRGMATVMAERLIHENVYTNRGCIDTTVDPWKACETLDEERRDSYHNVMAISLPGNAHRLHVPEQDMFILQRDPARNIVSGQHFFPV